jgi:hypothetical protein
MNKPALEEALHETMKPSRPSWPQNAAPRWSASCAPARNTMSASSPDRLELALHADLQPVCRPVRPRLVCRAGAVELGGAVPDCRDHRLRADRAGPVRRPGIRSARPDRLHRRHAGAAPPATAGRHRGAVRQGGRLQAHRRIAGRRHRRHRLEAQQLEDQGIWIAARRLCAAADHQGGAGNRCQHGAGKPLLRLAVRPIHPGGHAGALHRAECGVRRADHGRRHAALCLPRVLSGAGRLPHRSGHPAHRHQVGRGLLQLRGDQWRGVVRLHHLRHPAVAGCAGDDLRQDAVGGDRQLHHAADLAVGGRAHGDLFRRVPVATWGCWAFGKRR